MSEQHRRLPGQYGYDPVDDDGLEPDRDDPPFDPAEADYQAAKEYGA